MFTRKEVAEERKIYARKRQAYRQIGVFSNGLFRKAVSLKFLKQQSLNWGVSKNNQKNVLFAMEDGSTTFVRVSEYMASKTHKKLLTLDLVVTFLVLLSLVIWTFEVNFSITLRLKHF